MIVPVREIVPQNHHSAIFFIRMYYYYYYLLFIVEYMYYQKKLGARNHVFTSFKQYSICHAAQDPIINIPHI